MRFVLFVCLWLFAGGVAADDVMQLPNGGTSRVTRVVDGDTVLLADGRQVRLVGIQAPKLPFGRKGFEPWPLADESKVFLEQQILGEDVQVRLAPHGEDRYGRVLAHLVRAKDGVWVQGALLTVGLARVYTFPDNRILAAEMLVAEDRARETKTGIWALPYYAVRNADTVLKDVGTFQVVEDRIVDVARVRKWVYLNFGANWRTDFTVKIRTKYLRMFSKADVDVMSLKGKRVRVRGWLKHQNGAMIELDHPERLELLGP